MSHSVRFAQRKELIIEPKSQDHGVIASDGVAKAMAETDRKHYSPRNPYMDAPQPIGGGVTISAPHMVIKTKVFIGPPLRGYMGIASQKQEHLQRVL